MRAPKMNNGPPPSIACWLPAETIPASATTVLSATTVPSVSWYAAQKAWVAGTIVMVSALLPSNALTIKRKPPEPVSSYEESPDRAAAGRDKPEPGPLRVTIEQLCVNTPCQ